jgi:DNA-binding NarL/FixJ family response regulator
MSSVLIVDDHPAIYFALKLFLDAENESITTDGRNVMAIICESTPNLIILDIALLKQGSPDLLMRIRQAGVSARVLILPGPPVSTYAARSLQAGADGFLSKQHLLSAIKRCSTPVAGRLQLFSR